MAACDLYTTLNNALYATDRAKIGYMLSYMGGDVDEWKVAIIMEMMEHEGTSKVKAEEETVTWDDYKEFKKRFLRDWSETDSAGSALAKLRTLRVGQDMTMKDYIVKFKNYSTRAKITGDPALIALFQDGLPISAVEEGMKQGHATIAKWYQMAERHELVWEMRKRRRSSPDRSYEKETIRTEETEIRSAEIVTDNEEFRIIGKCSRCGERGHKAKKCPMKSQIQITPAVYEIERIIRAASIAEANQGPNLSDDTTKVIRATFSKPARPIKSAQGHDLANRIITLLMSVSQEKRDATINELIEDGTLRCPTPDNDTDDMDIGPITIESQDNKKILIPIEVKDAVATEALIDCGADDLFIDTEAAEGMDQLELEHPILLENIDGTLNRNGTITHKTWIKYEIGGKQLADWFFVTRLGDQQLILGMPWLEKYNPLINWETKTIRLDDPIITEEEETSTDNQIKSLIRLTITESIKSDRPTTTHHTATPSRIRPRQTAYG